MSRFAAPTCLVALLVVVAVLPAPGIALSTTHGSPIASNQEQAGTTVTHNNSTKHHEDPGNISTKNSTSELKRWLASRLTARLGASTVKISKGQYRKADSKLGDRYNDLLDKYVDVAGKTKETGDDKTAKNLKKTQRKQKKYVSRVKRYRTLHQRYQRARNNGNDAKARRLAHRLERLQRNISESSSDLTKNYDDLSNNTNLNTSREVRQIKNVTNGIAEQQTTVRKREFDRTNMSVVVESHNVSFLDPIRISGRLTNENGTGIENRTIRLRLGENRSAPITARTDEDGSFALVGRPALMALGRQPFRVEYRPNLASTYLGSNATVRAKVSQSVANISIAKHTRRTRYNRTVSVSGRVQAEGIVAPDVPVAVYVGHERLGTTRAAGNGTFSFDATLPAGIPPGKHRIRVTVPLKNRALTASNTTAPTTIGTTATNLTLSGATEMGRRVNLSGQLHTRAGIPITNQRVTIFADGTKVTSTRTNSNGSYQVTSVIPEALLAADGNTTFVARFDGRGKNVKSARDSTSLAVSAGETGPLSGLPRKWLVSFGVIAIAVLGGLFLWRTDIRGGENLDTSDETPNPVETTTTDASTSSLAMTFLDRARAARDAGEYKTAVVMGYAATRTRFSSAVPAATSTHWEFYAACREADLPDETLSKIGDVTRRYEEAAFAETGVTRESATTVIDAVDAFVEDEGTTE